MTRTLTTLVRGFAGVVDILDGASVGGGVAIVVVSLLVAVVELDDVVVY